MSTLKVVFFIVATPSILSMGSRWFVRGGYMSKLFVTMTLVLSGFALTQFAFGAIGAKALVAMLTPAFQALLGVLIATMFKRHYGRDLRLIAYDLVLDSELLPDVRVSSLFFIVAIGLPLLAYAPFAGH